MRGILPPLPLWRTKVENASKFSPAAPNGELQTRGVHAAQWAWGDLGIYQETTLELWTDGARRSR